MKLRCYLCTWNRGSKGTNIFRLVERDNVEMWRKNVPGLCSCARELNAVFKFWIGGVYVLVLFCSPPPSCWLENSMLVAPSFSPSFSVSVHSWVVKLLDTWSCFLSSVFEEYLLCTGMNAVHKWLVSSQFFSKTNLMQSLVNLLLLLVGAVHGRAFVC